MKAVFRFITELTVDILLGMSVASLIVMGTYLVTGQVKWMFVAFIILSIGLYPLLMALGIGKKTARAFFPVRKNEGKPV